jgi:DNA-binding winged helix-turn-helix (wHTH) protein
VERWSVMGSKNLRVFGPFQVDPGERVLMKSGNVVPLTPKAFDLLLVLTGSSGHLLEKRELMNAVWPDTFVEEANLAQHISLLRKALGDRADSPEYIQTVARRGYRFLLPVQETEEAETPSGLARDTAHDEPATKHRSSRRFPVWLRIAAYGGLAALLALAILLAWR